MKQSEILLSFNTTISKIENKNDSEFNRIIKIKYTDNPKRIKGNAECRVILFSFILSTKSYLFTFRIK